MSNTVFINPNSNILLFNMPIRDKSNHLSAQEKVDSLIKMSSEKEREDSITALKLARKARDISQEIFYTKGLSHSLKQMALIYQGASNYGEAMKLALEAMNMFQSVKDYRGEAECLNILGGVYNFLGDYKKRLECNLKGLQLRQKINDVTAQLSSFNNIGDTYTVMGDYKNALKYFELCLTFDLSPRMKAIVNYNIGEVYYFQKKYRKAVEFIEKGLCYGKECDYWQIIISSYQMLANMSILKKEYHEAINNLMKALKIAEKKKSKENQYPIFELLAIAYGDLKDFEKAYRYLNKHKLFKTEILNDNNAQKLKKIEFDFQFKSIQTETQEIKEKNKQITRAFKEIELQRNDIAQKNTSITDSIRYAKRIQNGILPSDEKVKNALREHFVFYQPKDIVSGDFYWIEQVNDVALFSVIDCTGHGVPGAFVSLIAFNMLNKVVLEKQITKPSEILAEIDKMMWNLFKNSSDKVRDGMDMGICRWNVKNQLLDFAGANHSLFIYNRQEIKEIKGNRKSIGLSIDNKKNDFINHSLKIEPGAIVYLSSDGFPHQFGGDKGKKLKWKGFTNLLEEIKLLPLNKQSDKMQNFFTVWKNNQEQLDDVCVMGIQL